MADQYAGLNPLMGSALHAAAVTPHDANEFPVPTKGLYVGGAGNVNVLLAGDTVPVVFVGVGAGTILPVRATKVLSSSTTASNIVRLY